jgi:hypothetical protein
MRHIKDLKQFVNEKIEYASTYVNGEEVTSSWSGSADNEKDFIKMIKAMPETIESIRVTSSTSSFDPSSEEFKGPINSSKKNKIIKIVKDMTKAFKEKGDDVTSYELRSYYGPAGKNHETHPAYIQYRTKRIEQFNKDMSSGKYGRLD